MAVEGFLTESYSYQAREVWPRDGKHILAQFDDDTIVVYQAFNPTIAAYAVAHQNFDGAPGYSRGRMTWIKTNFLWMMFRCGWASKHNQERVLALWLRRAAFDSYLENARIHGSVRGFTGTVRLQWDPDHLPTGSPHPRRRAVQLGLRGVESFTSGADIVRIADVTDFVRSGKPLATPGGSPDLVVARERVYLPASAAAREALNLSEPPAADAAGAPVRAAEGGEAAEA